MLCLGFFSHSWPGFNNVEIWQQQFAPESISHSFYWNWDKLFVAVALLPWLLLRDGRSHSGPEFGRRQPLGLLLAIFALTIALSFAAAFALGLIEWQSKWGLIEQQWPQLLLFALSMLVIVVTAEECVFRGMLQHCACRYLSAWGVLIISGLFFGAVHVGFSPLFAIVAGVAGLGYCAIYYFSASILWSIALHFGLNVIHFLFFSYPMLALG